MSTKTKLMSLGQALEIINLTIEYIESIGAIEMYPKQVLRHLADAPGDWIKENWPHDRDDVTPGEEVTDYDFPLDEDGNWTTVDKTTHFRKVKHADPCAKKFREHLERTCAKLRTHTRRAALPQRRRRKYGEVATRNASKRKT